MNKGIIVKFLLQSKVFFIEETNSENIWNNMISILKSMGNINSDDSSFTYFKYQREFYKNLVNNFIDLLKEKNINFIELPNEDEISKYNYNLSIAIVCYHSSNKIEMFIENKSGILLNSKIWDCNKLSGNCIDRFIRNKLISKIHFIDNLIIQIKSRKKDRTDKLEYHQTSCYERDYLQLCLIRDTAKKIMEDCNKKLSILSENYTKID